VKNVWQQGGTTPFALGVDPERHWDQIAKHLMYTDHIIDFDVKAWESKVSLSLLNLNCEVMYELLSEAYLSRGEKLDFPKNIIYGIAVDYTDTEVIFENIMYRKRSGLLSGHPGTFMENSMIHEMILGLIIRRILQRKAPNWANIAFIAEHVKSIKAADDIQIALSPKARSVISVDDIVEGYNELTFEVTSADKDSEIRVKPLHESQFLKNGFRLTTDDRYHAVPNLSIIHQLFNWVRDDTKLNTTDQFHVNVENAFRFAFWRGKDEYEEIRAKFNLAALKINTSWPYCFEEMTVLMKAAIFKAEQVATSRVPREELEQY